jgi:hypothetical protein
MSLNLRLSAFLLILVLSPGAWGDLKEDLLAAAKKGDTKAVETLLAQGVDPNSKTPYGVTPLYYAAGKGHLDVVKILLKHKADPNIKETFYSTSILGQAVEQGNADIVRALLDAGATGAGDQLPGAVRGGKGAVVRAILEKAKIKPETLNNALATVSSEKSEIAELLKKAGAKAPTTPAVTLDAGTLKSCEGTYRSKENGFDLIVALKDGKLVVRFDKTELFSLRPTSPVAFQIVGQPGSVTFKKEGAKATAFTAKFGAVASTSDRVEPGKAAKPVAKRAPLD